MAPAELQNRFRFEPAGEAFGMVLPKAGGGLQVVAVSSATTEVRVIERLTNREVLNFPLTAGGMVQKTLP
jgi:hypothetical protein